MKKAAATSMLVAQCRRLNNEANRIEMIISSIKEAGDDNKNKPPLFNVSTAKAWRTTPGTACITGTGTISPNSIAVDPISISFPRNWSGSIELLRRSTTEI